MNPINTSVLLIYTGGTIGMIENAATGALENFNFEQLQKHIPELQKFNFPIDTYQFDPPMDSSDMEPDMWQKLVHVIHDNYERYQGFVILQACHPDGFSTSDRGTSHGWERESDDKYRDCHRTEQGGKGARTGSLHLL